MVYIKLIEEYERVKEVYVPAKWLLEKGVPFPEKIVLEIEGGILVKAMVKRIVVKKAVEYGERDLDTIKGFMEENGVFNDFPPFMKQDRVYRIELL